MSGQNRFLNSAFSGSLSITRNSFAKANQFRNYSTAKDRTYALVSNGGVMMDPFYRDVSERRHNGGRTKHLGMDITGQVAGTGSWDDPRRGQTVYGAIKSTIALSDISAARAYDKRAEQNYTVNIAGSGNATLHEVKIKKQPWSSQEDHSYGGIVALHCIYTYTNNSGTASQFTLYLEFLHLITENFLPKNASGAVATLPYWNGLQRGIGFGPTIEQNNDQTVPASTFAGPNYPIIGYLGATQTPHVHVQVAYFDGRSFSRDANIRIDPDVMVL